VVVITQSMLCGVKRPRYTGSGLGRTLAAVDGFKSGVVGIRRIRVALKKALIKVKILKGGVNGMR
jgi:hypothetical protein